MCSSWHCNPKIYKEDDKPIPFNDFFAKEIWKKDEERYNKLKNKGIKTIIIWENEYRNSGLDKSVENIINKINEKK